MNMKDVSKELYEIMFDPKLLAMQKYEMIKTLLDECYQRGYCDGMKDSDELYAKLFLDDFDDDALMFEEW